MKGFLAVRTGGTGRSFVECTQGSCQAHGGQPPDSLQARAAEIAGARQLREEVSTRPTRWSTGAAYPSARPGIDYRELSVNQRSDLTEVGAMRHRAADRVDRGVADHEIEIGAFRAEGVVAGRADLRTGLPPAVLTADDPRIEALVQAARARNCPPASRSLPSRPRRMPRSSAAAGCNSTSDRGRAGAGSAARGAGSGRTAWTWRRSGSAGSAGPGQAARAVR